MYVCGTARIHGLTKRRKKFKHVMLMHKHAHVSYTDYLPPSSDLTIHY